MSVTWNVALLERDMAERGWSQNDLARAAGVSQSSVSNFVRGQHQTNQLARRLAVALGYSPKRYLGNT